MPTLAKVGVYFLVMIVLVSATNTIPKDYEPFKGLAAILSLVWMVAGVFIVIRAAFRFVTR